METVTYTFLVDFARPQRTNELLVMQNDSLTRTARFILMNNGKPMDVEDVSQVTVNAVLPDDSSITAEAALQQDEDEENINEILFTIPASMTAAVGKTVCTITLYDTTDSNVPQQLSSFEFYINTKNELNTNSEEGEDAMAGLRDLLERAEEAIETVEQLSAQTALPNPYPLRMIIEKLVEGEYEEEQIDYNGSVMKTIDFQEIFSRVAELESAFPDGCRIIAQAITNNGVTTADNASPSTMATNIGLIRSTGDAAAGEILNGKKAWVNKSLVTGSMPNRGTVTQTLNCGESYTITDGYHSGSGTVTANSLASQTGVDSGYTAVADTNMQVGYQGWVNGTKVTGSMPALTSSNFSGAHSSSTAGADSNYVVTSTARGYVANNTAVHTAAAGTNATAIETTGATGTQMINIVPGIYNKIKVDQTNAYTAGYNAGYATGKDAVTNAVAKIFDGTIQLNQTTNQNTATKVINTSRSCLVLLYSGSFNVWGYWKRVGTTVSAFHTSGQGIGCTATDSAITISYRNDSYAEGKYMIICIDKDE